METRNKDGVEEHKHEGHARWHPITREHKDAIPVETGEGTFTAIVKDREVTEITGFIRGITFTEDLKAGIVTVEDVDEGMHDIYVKGKTHIWSLFYQSDSGKYLGGMNEFMNMSQEDQDAEVSRICSLDKVIVFRTILDEETNKIVLFAAVSTKYMKTKIEDLVPIVQKTLENKEDLTITESSTGRYGGAARIRLKDDENAEYDVGISAGILDGGNAIRIWGHGMILFCSNQMTFEVATAFKDVPQLALGSRTVHSGDIENFESKLLEIMSRVTQFSEALTDAQKVEIDESQVNKVLDFYQGVGTLSKRTRTILETNMTDDVQQVPGTVWGLSMVMTWVGTHADLKDGVKYNLQRIGGELLIVASDWDKYEEVVDKKIIEMEATVS